MTSQEDNFRRACLWACAQPLLLLLLLQTHAHSRLFTHGINGLTQITPNNFLGPANTAP